MTREEIKDIVLGRDDLLAVMEQICYDSGIENADGESLCETVAGVCVDYLYDIQDWGDDYRTFADTQIFKEYRDDKCEITKEEWDIIKYYARTDIWSDGYRYYDDKANGLFAFSFSKVNQKENPDWGDEVVYKLNSLAPDGDGDWFLGDEKEEYVFVD